MRGHHPFAVAVRILSALGLLLGPVAVRSGRADGLLPTALAEQVQPVLDAQADDETDPVLPAIDAADDPVIWSNENDPGAFAVIGTDREGALEVYDETGARIQRIADGTPDNVDLRKGFRLAGRTVDLIGIGDAGAARPGDGVLRFYAIDPATRMLTNVTTGGRLTFGVRSYGFCMYRSPVSGTVFAFTQDKADGRVEQVELVDAGGTVSGRVVRSFDVGSRTEGCVADDALKHFYISEEGHGIWKYGAEPGDSAIERTIVDTTGGGGHIKTPEGLTIVQQPADSGYLIASSQGEDSFVVYRREGANEFVRELHVVEGPGADGCTHTDGIDAVAGNLGPSYPHGLFVCQDNKNTLPGTFGHQNFKYVRLEKIVAPTPSVPERSEHPAMR